MVSLSKVLITGIHGFTGVHLATELRGAGYQVVGLSSDILNVPDLRSEIENVAPDYVVHLAAISDTVHSQVEQIYQTNIVGTLNLLDVLKASSSLVKRVIVASSASVYGNVYAEPVSEQLCPRPVSHYGCSKLSMEHLIESYRRSLDIVVVRPFNYTGVGHDCRFLIPKIVSAYVDKQPVLELGNVNVAREFNDVRDVCRVYRNILERANCPSILNICSGRAIYIAELIDLMDELAGSKMEVHTDSSLVRSNEIDVLCGDPQLLQSTVGVRWNYTIRDTLDWMYSSGFEGE